MSNLPFVSILMPIRNEAGFIRRSLGAALAQDYPQECLEVIVADGMSTDATREIIEAMQRQYPNLRLIDNPGMIVPTGLNRAIKEARGDIIVRIDGHTIVEPDYVSECVATLQRTGADNVGGRMDPVSEGVFGQAVALATSSPFGVGGSRFHYAQNEEWVDSVYMGAWPITVFERNGLFDEELVRNQDDEFNYRLRSQGGKVLLNPRIKSHYYNRSTARSLWRQYFQYGLWKVRVMQKHPRQMSARHFAPSVLAAALIFSAMLAPFSDAGRVLFALVAGAYILANLVASVLVALKAQNKNVSQAIPQLPAIFAILHLSYGLGFLAGLVKFRNRWKVGLESWKVGKLEG